METNLALSEYVSVSKHNEYPGKAFLDFAGDIIKSSYYQNSGKIDSPGYSSSFDTMVIFQHPNELSTNLVNKLLAANMKVPLAISGSSSYSGIRTWVALIDEGVNTKLLKVFKESITALQTGNIGIEEFYKILCANQPEYDNY